MADVAVFGLVGSGIIGSGWAARALARPEGGDAGIVDRLAAGLGMQVQGGV